MTKDTKKEKDLYRPCVGICLFNKNGQVFVGERNDAPEAWQMPQGGIDKGEDPKEAALREMMEEIGTNKARLLAQTSDWLYYDLPADLAAKMWKGKYKGQKQLWFAFEFEGRDEDINIQTEHPEFQRWQWVEFEQIVELIVEFKRELYQQVFDSFKDIKQR